MDNIDKINFLMESFLGLDRFFIDDCDIFYDEKTILSEDMNDTKMRDFLKKMKLGRVGFQFIRKSDNKRRKAIGTLNQKLMKQDGMVPLSNHQKTLVQRYPGYKYIFTYWDLEKHMWRCFDRRNFVKIGYK